MAERPVVLPPASEERTLIQAPRFPRAVQFRSHAACGIFAANAVSLSDRELWLRKQRSWLDRAYHEELAQRNTSQAPCGFEGRFGPGN
jgi:hypothetical protein